MTRPLLMTPGVQFREIDLSQYIRNLSTTKLAIVGTAKKGPVNQAVLITSLEQGINKFGVPDEDHPALIVMREFFAGGGFQLWFVRVVRDDAIATTTIDTIDGGTEAIEAKTSGSFFNDVRVKISYSDQLILTTSQVHSFGPAAGSFLYNQNPGYPLVPGTIIIKFNGVVALKDDSAGNLVGQGIYAADYSGSVDYTTGDITIDNGILGAAFAPTILTQENYWSTFNIQSVFNVFDISGNFRNRYNVESFASLTLTNMVEQLARSQYIKLTSGLAFGAFPVAGTYTMTGGDDGITNITDADYIGNTIAGATGMQIFAFPDEIDINVLMIPDRSQRLAVRQAMVQLCETKRFDTICILDPPPNLDPQTVADWADGLGPYSVYNTINSTYAAIYYPWYSTFNNITGDIEHTPPSAAAASALAQSQWYQAPAGPHRGRISNFMDIDVKLNQGDRFFLGQHRINPISDLNGMGEMILGQYTATLEATSLDRIVARTTLMWIEKAVTTALFTLLFEPNIPRTWNRAIDIVQPYFNTLIKQQRLIQGVFFCDDITNQPNTISNNQMICAAVLQLPNTAEIILVNFILVAAGTQITEALVTQVNLAP